MRVADLYLARLYENLLSAPNRPGDVEFKVPHAEGACAVFRDLGMLTNKEDMAWRAKFRKIGQYKVTLRDAQ